MLHNGRKIKLDSEHGVVTCRERGAKYDVLLASGKTLYQSIDAAIIDLFIAQEKMFDAADYTAAGAAELLARAKTLGQPFVVAYGGDTYTDFLRDNTPSGYVNIEKYGFEKAQAWFAKRNLTLTGKEPWLNDPNRQVRGHRDFGWQPWIKFKFIHKKAYPFPVVCAGTVGKGRKFKRPIFILTDDGFITCTYQVFFEGLLKAGWEFVLWEGVKTEKSYASNIAAYGVPSLFA
jgi:hypothetical protein